ncbi:S1C family serine protease [Piscinibacter koreensis]|uniref:Trypsin-like peptidase domain-containing protein n=1 Tax=Piscinibacter koreensis TaxID=2742824 RepID=A0A7Y6NJY0_9BURK|nr:serine protease [Schlegelella koreensis]NUZ04522.1 trypsin-like peptidase domain-containing protein [Schlegelella koreensis]
MNRHHASRLAPLLGVALFTLSVAPTALASTAADVYAKVSAAVWKVMTYDADGLPLGQGSAVVVGRERLATNCHVLAKARRVSVRHGETTLDATLDLWDVQRDLCQLKASGLAAAPVSLADSGTLRVGQDVYAIGNPRKLDLTLSAGLISSLRRNASGHLLLVQTSASISSGSSGGGLFDDAGRLVGLTTLGLVGDAQNLNFAIPAAWLLELPERHARAEREQLERREPARGEVATAAREPATGNVAAPSSPAIPCTPIPWRRTSHPADAAHSNHPTHNPCKRDDVPAPGAEPRAKPQQRDPGSSPQSSTSDAGAPRTRTEQHAGLPVTTAAAERAPLPTPGRAAVAAEARPDAGAASDVRLNDLDQLPFSTEEMRRRYSLFLKQPVPRAFVITKSGSSRTASGAGELTPTERALRECRQSLVGECFVYAVDERVVYAGPAAR